MKKIALLIIGMVYFHLQAQNSTPVVLNHDTLFWIKANTVTFSAKERVDYIQKRIFTIIESNDEFYRDSLYVSKTEYGPLIRYKKMGIAIFLPNDSIGTGMTVDQLAAANLEILAQAIEKYHKEWTFENRLKKAGYGVLALVVFILLVTIINKIFKWGVSKIDSLKLKQLDNSKNHNLFKQHAGRFSFILTSILKTIRFVIITILAYSILPILFGIFPQTQYWSDLIVLYTLTPLKSIAHSLFNYIPNLFRIAIVFLITHFVIKGLRYVTKEIEIGTLTLKGFYAEWAKPTFNIIRFLLYAFMLVVIWPYLPGSDSPAFKGVSVFLGLLISFGSSSAIANGVAGLVITYMRPFKLGDRVKIGDVKGDVIEKSMLVTRIRTIKNEEITVPNATILSVYSVNYSNQAMDKGLILHTSITIGYDAPWRQVHELLLKAASKTELIEKDPIPFVLQIALNDFYVEYQINAYTRHARGMAAIYSELHQHIQDCFNEAGVEIMSPHYGSLRNGNTTTIPEKYRPSDYKADVFEVNNKG